MKVWNLSILILMFGCQKEVVEPTPQTTECQCFTQHEDIQLGQWVVTYTTPIQTALCSSETGLYEYTSIYNRSIVICQ